MLHQREQPRHCGLPHQRSEVDNVLSQHLDAVAAEWMDPKPTSPHLSASDIWFTCYFSLLGGMTGLLPDQIVQHADGALCGTHHTPAGGAVCRYLLQYVSEESSAGTGLRNDIIVHSSACCILRLRFLLRLGLRSGGDGRRLLRNDDWREGAQRCCCRRRRARAGGAKSGEGLANAQMEIHILG